MSPENSKALVGVHPTLFRNRHDGITLIDDFYFECGDGWYDLLKSCIESVGQELDKLPFPQDPDYYIYVTQIKEKFGTLRFYLSGETDAMSEIINKATALSAITCESCGDLGRIRRKAWVQTLCDKCNDAP